METQASRFFFSVSKKGRCCLEGYFPVEQYCRLTGVSKDTAHHRAIRGTVESFKEEKSGRWFIYFCDEADPIPDGFIHVSEYARKNHVHSNTVYRQAKQGIFEQEDFCFIRTMTPQGAHRISLYIKESVEYPNIPRIRNGRTIRGVLEKSRPDGYLTVMEFAVREGCSKHYVYNRLFSNKIRGKKINGHWYVDERISVKGDIKS